MEESVETLGIMPEVPGSRSAPGLPSTARTTVDTGTALPASPESLPAQEAHTHERISRRRTYLTLAAALVGASGLLLWRDAPTALLFLACAGTTRIFLPAVGRFARRNGAVALPGGRGIHALPTPLIGGAALFIPVALTLLALGLLGDPKAWGLLAGGTIVFASGLIDDLKTEGLRARYKILAQLVAGGVLLLAGFSLPAFGIPGVGTLELPSLFGLPLPSIALLLFWIVLATNALNLSDGLDGLATSLTILGMGVLAAAGVPGLVPVALAGACLGFLYFNLPRARIFLGDAGSLLLGFLLAALVLQLPVHANVPLALAAFAYPLGDVTLCVTRRLLRGKPLFAPDRSHIHHKALQYLGSPLRALLATVAFASLQAVILVIWPGVPALLLCACLWILVGGGLAFMGSYKPAQIMLTRRGMRRLHALQGYVATGLKTAQNTGEVEQSLVVLAEAVRLKHLSIDGIHITCRPMAPTNIETSDVRVTLAATHPHSTARFCTWSAAPTMEGPAVDQERETIMAGLLRQAAGRLQRLEAPPHLLPSSPDPSACSPLRTHRRPAQGQV